MVFLAENLKARDASCCNLLVVKGGSAARLSSFFSSLSTLNDAFFISAASLAASSPLDTFAFLPSTLRSFASKGGGLPPSNCAVRFQYSSGTNLLISSSRSQIIRTATDWTRPALKPLLTLSHR